MQNIVNYLVTTLEKRLPIFFPYFAYCRYRADIPIFHKGVITLINYDSIRAKPAPSKYKLF